VHVSVDSFTKGRSRMKVPGEGRNLVPDTWTTNGEGALRELGPCPHDNSCVGCRRTELHGGILIRHTSVCNPHAACEHPSA